MTLRTYFLGSGLAVLILAPCTGCSAQAGDAETIGSGLFPDHITVDATGVTAISSAGVFRLAKDGTSPEGGELIFPGTLALPGLVTTQNRVFWDNGHSLIRLSDDSQSTVAQVGPSASIGPIAASAGSVYWVEQKYSDVSYVRSDAGAMSVPIPSEVLGAVTLGEEYVSAIAGFGDCVFAIISRQDGDRLDRVCADAPVRTIYTSSEHATGLTVDDSGVYLTADGTGLRRLTPVESDAPAATTLVEGLVTRAVVSADFIYFIQNGRAGSGACGSDSSIRRMGKTDDVIEIVAPGPLACPTDLVLERDFVYWSEAEGLGAVRRQTLPVR